MRFYVLLRGERFVSLRGQLDALVEGLPANFGFYTTRVVDAPNVERAIELATAQVYQDLRLRSSYQEGTGVVVSEEVHPVSWFYRRLRPPRGFTFVVGESELDRSQ